MRLNKIHIEEPENIKCEFYSHNDNLLLFCKIVGTHRIGSEGNLDSEYIYSKLVAYYYWVKPCSIVLDLTDMEYSWGDRLLKIINFPSEIGRDEQEKQLPLLLIVSDKCKEGIASLLKVKNNRLPNWIYEDFEQAVQAAVKKANEWLEID